MLVATTLAVSLVVPSFLFLYLIPGWLSGGIAGIVMTASARILIIALLTLAAYLTEMGIFAVAYALGRGVLALGRFGGLTVAKPLDYYYFSIVSYTSLGLGDVFSSDHLRFITGVETLSGLLLIAWPGSFI